MPIRSTNKRRVLTWTWQNNWRQRNSTIHLSSNFNYQTGSESYVLNLEITEINPAELFISDVTSITDGRGFLCIKVGNKRRATSNHLFDTCLSPPHELPVLLVQWVNKWWDTGWIFHLSCSIDHITTSVSLRRHRKLFEVNHRHLFR